MFESLFIFSFLLGMGSQPSSERGQTYFEIPRLQGDFAYINEEKDSLRLQLRGTDNRDSVTKKNQVELSLVYAEVRSPFSENFYIEAGLVPNKWTQPQSKLWGFSYWGNDSEILMRRYKYIATGDLGLNAIFSLDSATSLALSAVNGEGNAKSETGPRKDIQAVLTHEREIWKFSLGYLRGGYDDYESSVSVKERTMVRATYLTEDLMFSLEGFEAKDPSIVLTQSAMADSLDLPLSPVESVKGQGASALVDWKWSSYWSAKTRYDLLNPAVGYSLRAMSSGSLAFVNKLTKAFEQAFIYSRTDYQENHSLQSEIREKVIWALRYKN